MAYIDQFINYLHFEIGYDLVQLGTNPDDGTPIIGKARFIQAYTTYGHIWRNWAGAERLVENVDEEDGWYSVHLDWEHSRRLKAAVKRTLEKIQRLHREGNLQLDSDRWSWHGWSYGSKGYQEQGGEQELIEWEARIEAEERNGGRL